MLCRSISCILSSVQRSQKKIYPPPREKKPKKPQKNKKTKQLSFHLTILSVHVVRYNMCFFFLNASVDITWLWLS